MSVVSSQIGKSSSEWTRRTVDLTLLLTLSTGAERERLATLEVRPLWDRGTGMALVGVCVASIDCWRRLASLPEGRPSFGGGNDLKVGFNLLSERSESDELLRKGSKRFEDGFLERSETVCDVTSAWAGIAGGDGWRAGRRDCLAGVKAELLSVVALSFGERFWLFRPEGLLSGVDEGVLDWGLTDLGFSGSTAGNLVTSRRTTSWALAPAGLGERFCLWFSLRGVDLCWDLCECDDRWGSCFGMIERSPGVRVGWTET
jgi:hypothetical protein